MHIQWGTDPVGATSPIPFELQSIEILVALVGSKKFRIGKPVITFFSFEMLFLLVPFRSVLRGVDVVK